MSEDFKPIKVKGWYMKDRTDREGNRDFITDYKYWRDCYFEEKKLHKASSRAVILLTITLLFACFMFIIVVTFVKP